MPDSNKNTNTSDVAPQPAEPSKKPGSLPEGTSAESSFLDEIYNKITSVIGGDNPNQYFCMSLPGTLIEPGDFEYDLSQPKPAHVKANESRLVNKLFDASFISVSDNGRQLQSQYKTALNMLSPKLNKELFELKLKLRDILRTPYPYNFGDGIITGMTLEQVFYRLYGEYVDAKTAWGKMQIDKRKELEHQIIDKMQREDKYLEWYGSVAEGQKVMLEEKLGRVLNVFSPGDMNIINGILNAGVGAEIEEARSTMNMVEELSPDGGYIYPVNLQPRNWFNLLEPSFTEVDLLESPAALSQRLHTLQMQRRNILKNIAKLSSTIPNDSAVAEKKKAFLDADKAYEDSITNCVDENSGASAEVVKSIIDLCIKDGNEVEPPDDFSAERTINKGRNEESSVKREEIKGLIDKLKDAGKKCYDAQADSVAKALACTKAALDWCETNNRMQLKTMLQPLQEDLTEINSDIEELTSRIAVSKAMQSSSEKDNVAEVMPNKETEGYTQILIESKMSSVSQQSKKESEASSSRGGVSFFLGGYSASKSHQKSVESAMSTDKETTIQIGMNVAKVQIERPWFNPGVFSLSENMYNFSGSKVSPEYTGTGFNDMDEEGIRKRFDEMNGCIFPAYPVAFVIAKDVSIKFSSQSSFSSSFAETIEDHASRGGGFFLFSASSSSSSSSSQSAAVANASANSITVRFTTPQILGYYMQATPADKSAHINDPNEKDISIIRFVSDFKQMLEDYSKKNNT